MTITIKYNKEKGCLEVISGRRIEATNIVTMTVAKVMKKDLKSIREYSNDNMW